jgi:hypothetical protein
MVDLTFVVTGGPLGVKSKSSFDIAKDNHIFTQTFDNVTYLFLISTFKLLTSFR